MHNAIRQAKKNSETFTANLLRWYKVHGRSDLPWKIEHSPYHVWLSEIMLQQTQVTTVIEYYHRFIRTLPTLASLANAEEDVVMQLWAGLGYYSRARNLHKAAKILMSEYQGQFPEEQDKLEALPGIGRSTAAAIVAQSFNLPAVILDGNVKRVLTRLHCLEGYPESSQVKPLLWEIAAAYSPADKRIADYTQAIMDLGATLCTRSSPNCSACPVSQTCKAFRTKSQNQYPTKKPKKTIPTQQANFLIITNTQQQIYLVKRPSPGIWGALWCLPQLETTDSIENWLEKNLKITSYKHTALPLYKHTFSHYHLLLHPQLITSRKRSSCKTPSAGWFYPEDALEYGLPAPIKKILITLIKERA